MIIKSVRVRNFRSILDETLPCDGLTALLGPNGSGKSSFLRALEIFYKPTASYTENDFYNRDITQDIVITVKFTDLAQNELELFKNYLDKNELSVEKVQKWPQTRANQKYYGSRLQNSDFDKFRCAAGGDLRREYNKVYVEYTDLPEYSNKETAEMELKKWEERNPNRCTQKRDDGQFFGFKEVGKANLELFTKFILIPAVRNASDDAIEGRGSVLTEILDLVIRSLLETREEVVNLQDEAQKLYNDVMNPIQQTELQELENMLSSTLETYVTDTKIKLNWSSVNRIDIPLPKADIGIVEDDFDIPIENTGHGLQRAFILTMLQHLAVIQTKVDKESQEDEEDEVPTSHLIIGIEEPELYQHPNRQRHLANIFLKLSTGVIGGVADRTQVIYTTHSPLFVDLKRFNQIRRLYKVKGVENKPKTTKVVFSSLDNIAKIIEKADGRAEGTYTGHTLEPRLYTLMTPWMNEGFFADVVVLVEGEEDRAAILGVASVLNYDFESMGISVIPCLGKNNIDKPTAIFKDLKYRVFVVWDGDYGIEGARPADNHRLLRLLSREVEDWPEYINSEFVCFKRNLNTTLRSEIGEKLFLELLSTYCDQFMITRQKDACKNPHVISQIIIEAKKKGSTSQTLENLVSQIINLRHME